MQDDPTIREALKSARKASNGLGTRILETRIPVSFLIRAARALARNALPIAVAIAVSFWVLFDADKQARIGFCEKWARSSNSVAWPSAAEWSGALFASPISRLNVVIMQREYEGELDTNFNPIRWGNNVLKDRAPNYWNVLAGALSEKHALHIVRLEDKLQDARCVSRGGYAVLGVAVLYGAISASFIYWVMTWFRRRPIKPVYSPPPVDS